mmetsp:Transcript_12222/g.30534  ORF Transcript_12222/g.30534 Transcript_12222/m.30534 type:complete len:244 (-) Transcript_12222:1492-2223(-)
MGFCLTIFPSAAMRTGRYFLRRASHLITDFVVLMPVSSSGMISNCSESICSPRSFALSASGPVRSIDRKKPLSRKRLESKTEPRSVSSSCLSLDFFPNAVFPSTVISMPPSSSDSGFPRFAGFGFAPLFRAASATPRFRARLLTRGFPGAWLAARLLPGSAAPFSSPVSESLPAASCSAWAWAVALTMSFIKFTTLRVFSIAEKVELDRAAPFFALSGRKDRMWAKKSCRSCSFWSSGERKPA